LIIDGTYFTGDLCLILYFDNDVKYTQLYRFSDKEDYRQIKEDLENLRVLGIEIESITCDGHKGLLRAIRKVYPHIILQRCVVHVQRDASIWLRQKPKTLAFIELRRIAMKLASIETKNDKLVWEQEFEGWHEKHKVFVNEQVVHPETGKKWYRHKLLHQTASMIIRARPNLFQYLDNPAVPKSTNALESFFGHLKDALSIHRGLRAPIEGPSSSGTCTSKTNVTKVFFSHIGNLNKPKGHGQSGPAPLGIQYTHKPYCWYRVLGTPQQSLIPLRVCARNILRKFPKKQEIFLISLPFYKETLY